MKKVLAAALFCAVSSFATWDLFPAQDAGKGEAKLGFAYGLPAEKMSGMALNLGARYSIIEGLEAGLMLNKDDGGFVLSCSFDSESCEDAGIGKNTGLNQPIIGVRYWLPMGLGIAVDVTLPFGGKDLVGDDPQLGLDAGVQFSTKINDQLSIGSEAILNIINNSGKDYSAGMNLNLAVEADYSIGSSTPFLGIDLQQGLTKGDKAEADKLTLGLSVGYTHDISESMYAQVGYWMGLVGDAYKDYAPKTVTIYYGIKF